MNAASLTLQHHANKGLKNRTKACRNIKSRLTASSALFCSCREFDLQVFAEDKDSSGAKRFVVATYTVICTCISICFRTYTCIHPQSFILTFMYAHTSSYICICFVPYTYAYNVCPTYVYTFRHGYAHTLCLTHAYAFWRIRMLILSVLHMSVFSVTTKENKKCL